MKQPLLLLLLPLSLTLSALSLGKVLPELQWEQTYGGNKQEVIHKMIPAENGYIFVGETESKGAGKSDAWLFKTDEEGEMLWERTIGGDDTDILKDIVSTGDGGYILVGSTSSKGKGQSDLWVVKLDEEGIVEWNKTYGSKKTEKGHAIIRKKNGEFVIAGTKHLGSLEVTGGNTNFEMDHFIWLLKIDSLGGIQWDERVHTDRMVVVTDFHETLDNGYLISATSKFEGVKKEDPFLVKVDDEGLILWKSWMGLEEVADMINTVLPLNDGTYMLAGTTMDLLDPIDGHGWLMRMDGRGHVLWEKRFGGKGGDEFYDMKLSKDGHILLVGAMGSSSPEKGSMWLMKTDKNGEHQWEITTGKGLYEKAYQVEETSEGDILVAGNEITHLLPNSDGTTPNWETGVKKYGDVRLVKLGSGTNLRKKELPKEEKQEEPEPPLEEEDVEAAAPVMELQNPYKEVGIVNNKETEEEDIIIEVLGNEEEKLKLSEPLIEEGEDSPANKERE